MAQSTQISSEAVKKKGKGGPIPTTSNRTRRKRTIFLACQRLFHGSLPFTETTESIKAKLLAEKNMPDMLDGCGSRRTATDLKNLIDAGVFEATDHGRLLRQNLFEDPPKSYPESNKGLATRGIMLGRHAAVAPKPPVNAELSIEEEAGSSHEMVLSSMSAMPSSTQAQIPQNQAAPQSPKNSMSILFSRLVQIPLHAQHRILVKIQHVLEESCYDFTKKHNPNVLMEMKWDCPESIELNCWTSYYHNRQKALEMAGFTVDEKQLHHIMLAVNKLRHAAVHRLRVSCHGLYLMVTDAVRFVEALGDFARAVPLKNILQEVQAELQSQEKIKTFFNSLLRQELDEIERQQMLLNVQQGHILQAADAVEKENAALIGANLESSINKVWQNSKET